MWILFCHSALSEANICSPKTKNHIQAIIFQLLVPLDEARVPRRFSPKLDPSTQLHKKRPKPHIIPLINSEMHYKSFTDWSQNMCSNGTYSIWFIHHQTLKSSYLTQIDAKALAMGLTCILEIYLRFKGRKGCKLNYFRFWKIKKGLNKELSESKLMDYEERQNEDITSLGNEE